MTPQKEAPASKDGWAENKAKLLTNRVWLTLDQAKALTRDIQSALLDADSGGFERGKEAGIAIGRAAFKRINTARLSDTKGGEGGGQEGKGELHEN